MEQGGELDAGGFEDSLRRGWSSVLHIPSGGVRLLLRDRRRLADRDAVRGFGAAHARRLPNRIGGRFQPACSLLLR